MEKIDTFHSLVSIDFFLPNENQYFLPMIASSFQVIALMNTANTNRKLRNSRYIDELI